MTFDARCCSALLLFFCSFLSSNQLFIFFFLLFKHKRRMFSLFNSGLSHLARPCSLISDSLFVRNHAFRASIGRIQRGVYSRLYPVRLIKQDGSSVNIWYHEPCGIIKLPFDLNLLDETDRKRRLLKRQMSGAQTKRDASNILPDKSLKFDPKKYINKSKKPQ